MSTPQPCAPAQARFTFAENDAARFWAFHQENPHVYVALRRFALEAIATTHRRRWRRGQAWLRALWERNQPAILAGHARRAHAASERQANERLTAAESALWRRARLVGQNNGRAKADTRVRHAFGVRTQQARAGAIGGRKDAPVKHRRAYLRALGIVGLTPTARTRDLWSRSYLAGYAGSYDARLAYLRARKRATAA